jgi:hypothetical protein
MKLDKQIKLYFRRFDVEKLNSYFLKRKTHKKFFEAHGYPLNLEQPKTWNEKIQYQKFFGDMQKMALFADKVRVREWVAHRADTKYLIPVIGCYRSAEEINWANLPSQFVMKTNHGSGDQHLVICHEKDKLSEQDVKLKMQKALKIDFGLENGESFYSHIPRRIIIEHLIGEPSQTLTDFKIHCFRKANQLKMVIQVDSGRFSHHQRNLFDTNWNELEMKINHYSQVKDVKKPAPLAEMLKLAETLSQDFSYIRVDLYAVGDQVFFGEMTQTHASGYESVHPRSADLDWGNLF